MSDDEIIKTVAQHDDKAVTAGEVAKNVEISRAGVLQRLDKLADEEVVTKKKVGSRAVVWWVSDS